MASQGQRFRRKALRRGYKVDEVDAFLDRVEATLAGEPAGAPVASQEVHDVVFRVRFNGYDEWQVDLHLDRVERQLAELEERGGALPPARSGDRLGPPDRMGPPEHRMGPPDRMGLPEHRMGPPDRMGPPEHRMGPPDRMGPPSTAWVRRTGWVPLIGWVRRIGWGRPTAWVPRIGWARPTAWVPRTGWVPRTVWVRRTGWGRPTRWVRRTGWVRRCVTSAGGRFHRRYRPGRCPHSPVRATGTVGTRNRPVPSRAASTRPGRTTTPRHAVMPRPRPGTAVRRPVVSPPAPAGTGRTTGSMASRRVGAAGRT